MADDVPGPDTPTWTIDRGALLYGPEGEFHAYSDMLGLVGGLGAPESEAFAALVADVRAARRYEGLRESIAAEADIVDDPEHHYSGPAVAQILRALLHEED